MKSLSYLSTLTGLAVATFTTFAAPSFAQTTIEVMQSYGSHRERIHQPVADAFMAVNPNVIIKFRAPAQDYNEGHLTIVREALTNRTPDVWYTGHHLFEELVGTLEPRGKIMDLTPLLEAEGAEWVKANFAENVLDLGRIGDTQWAMPFNASTPIVYYNLDLVEQAGGDANDLPSDWEEVVALAKKIAAVGDDVDGATVNLSLDGDWLWQAMVFSYGGKMMNIEKTEVAFNDDAGLNSVHMIRRLVEETGMPLMNEEQGIQQFAAGKMGMFFGSTAEVRTMGDTVGDKFKWKTGSFPINDKVNGRLPVGGNSAVILTTDPEKQKAAWEFIKFATSPEGQKLAVLGSGYMPTNIRTEQMEYLGDHYKNNPDWTTSMKQWPIAVSWFGYPGGKGVRVWHEQHNILYSIGRGDVSPEAGLEQLVETTESLLSK